MVLNFCGYVQSEKKIMVDDYSMDERQCAEVSQSIIECEQLTTRETHIPWPQ